MTITAKGDLETLDQIIKNVNKLVDVIHCAEHDASHSLDRELALLKVKATPASKAAAAKHSSKYHAKVIDTQEGRLIIAQSGTTQELDEFEDLMKKYGVVEYVRSGKLLMAKGREET
jgi:acetolactate synthase small subunit